METPDFKFLADALEPLGLDAYASLIGGSVTALLLIIVGFIVAGWIAGIVRKMLLNRKVDQSLAGFLASLTRWLVVAAALITALSTVGIETTSLVALLGSAGLAIGLALQGNLAHFASGVMVLLFRPFQVDDYIAAAGHEGTVTEVGLFTTTLLTLDNEIVIIPNGAVTGSPITNYSTSGSRRTQIAVGVAYGVKVADVLPVLQKAAERCELVLKDPAPGVAFVGLGASSIDFVVHVYCKPNDFHAMIHEARTAVYTDLEAAGIEIPFSQIVVHQADAAAAAE